MSTRTMWRWWRLLALFLLASVIFYLFLIGANYYYATRAVYLLQRIRSLKIDNSTIEEFKRLGSEHGLRYEVPGWCASPCLMVSPNNGWMHSLLLWSERAGLGQHVGLNAWQARGYIVIENGRVTGKAYDLAILDGNVFPETRVSASDQQHSELSSCIYRPLKRHPGYEIHRASNVNALRVIVSDGVSDEDRARAFHINLGCLTSWRSCDRLSDFMSSAWADYQSDLEWVREHPGDHAAQCE